MWPKREYYIFRASLLIAAKVFCPGEKISIKYKLLSTSRANMVSAIRIPEFVISNLWKLSRCICLWEIRFIPAPSIYWTLFKIKTYGFPLRDLQVRWMSPSSSADILLQRHLIRGWLVGTCKFENVEWSWQIWQELAES